MAAPPRARHRVTPHRRDRGRKSEPLDVAARPPLPHDEASDDRTIDALLMASLARTSGGIRADARPALVVATKPGGAARLERAHETLLSDAEPRVHPFLKASHRTALSAFEGGARSDAADRIAVGALRGGRCRVARGRGRARRDRRGDRGRHPRGVARRACRGCPLRPAPNGLLEPAAPRAAAAGRLRDPAAAARPARHRQRGIAVAPGGGERRAGAGHR